MSFPGGNGAKDHMANANNFQGFHGYFDFAYLEIL